MEADWGSAVYYYFTLVGNHLAVFVRHAETFDDKISVNWYDLLRCKFIEFFLTECLFDALEALWF